MKQMRRQQQKGRYAMRRLQLHKYHSPPTQPKILLYILNHTDVTL